jgi:tetratricopeptide (TPR) repeat protein
MRIVCLVFALVLLRSVVFSQEKLSTTCKAAISNFETASAYIDQHNLKKAIVELHEATLNDDKFIEAYMLMADAYRADFDYLDSKLAYQKAYEINPNYAPERYFYFAETELKIGEYLSAKKHFLKYLSVAKEGDKNFVKAQKHIKPSSF